MELELYFSLLSVCMFSKVYVTLQLILDAISSGLPWWLSGKESARNTGGGKRHRFSPWVIYMLNVLGSNPVDDME